MKIANKILLLYLFLSISACSFLGNNTPSDTLASGDCPKVIPTPLPTPKFLLVASPIGTINKSDYEAFIKDSAGDSGGIYAEISAEGVDQSVIDSADRNRYLKIAERVILLVDNHKFDGLPSRLADMLVSDGPFGFRWTIPLEDGYHQAKLIINTDTGETIEYEWSFCITP